MSNLFQKAFGKLQDAAKTLLEAQDLSDIKEAEIMAVEALFGLSGTPMAVPAAKMAGRVLVGARKARVLMGIRMKDRPPRVPIATMLVDRAAASVRRAYPQVQRLHLVGSRLRHPEARDIEFVAVVGHEGDLPDGGRTIVDAVTVDGFGVDVFFSLPAEVGPHILEFGTGMDITRIKRRAIKKGYHLNRYGLWKGTRLVSQDILEIMKRIGMPVKPHWIWSLEHPL